MLFRAAAGGTRLRLGGAVVGWYVVVSLLHAFWDLSGGLAALITWWLTAQDWQYELIRRGRVPAPTDGRRHLYTALSWGFLLLESVIALLCLRHVLAPRRGRRRAASSAAFAP